ncbi:UvrD-helicase domain-containing protein [Psychrobacter sp. FDAARGOS_221]|uniref:UvrD-helicase domain-containing protein n=1 Tax=Psychrobacter sp. FDAARGOS_221 TaxID=1975705 RepID=UPI000BB59C86|nr:UvrD-helicase domain-containing protein [Psychrobacter sp. FDAARGOS_221]PNK59654.1 exodeoxyribonuclease V subunit beta [Psychrobacter sp. FDAARGOS_221]
MTQSDSMTTSLNQDSSQPASQPAKPKEIIPAIDVDLTGRHLIEASAGTGKTWTLTGIVLRLLIEARRAPEQIIATTFTRAAAAEMRQRIHDRLVEFYQLLKWVDVLSANPANHDELYPTELVIKPDAEADKAKSSTDIEAHDENQDAHAEQQRLIEKKEACKQQQAEWLKEQAKYARLDGIMGDPVNMHLVQYLLQHLHTYKLSEAIRRTALVLTTLDKLFVGTLDSLAQKWLSEYSSETGHQQGMSIIEDHSIEQVTDSIIHDELRQFQSRLYYEQPRLYKLLDQQGKLTDVADHRGFVQRSLNFFSATIDEVPVIDFSFDEYEQLLNDFSQLDLTDIEPYLNPDYRKSQGFNGRSSLQTRFEHIIEIHKVISQRGLGFESYLSEDAKKLIEAIEAARYPQEDGKIKNFNSKREKEHQVFFGLTTISKLMDVIDMSNGLESYTTGLLANLNRHIVLAVRERLPIILEERSQTTFSLQMVRLNQALSGKQGDKLARYIRHHYPVALIDESQDINGEQAIMIQSVYLPNTKNRKQRSNNEFLLLVGDPKQAIYGFRGGDVANYNAMKRQFDDKHIWTLNVNRRSNGAVIDALNHWFCMPTQDSAKQHHLAKLGEGIYYQYIEAANEEAKLSWMQSLQQGQQAQQSERQQDLNQELHQHVLPNRGVSLINLPYDTEASYNEFEVTAKHIAMLLNSGQTLDGKPIKPSDIGVLARAKKQLKQLENELVKLKIPTLTTSDASIFETVIAEDVAAILSAMLQPYRHDLVNRVLTSHLYGFSVKQAKAMMMDYETGVAEADHTSSISNTGISNDSQADDNQAQQTDKQSKKSYQDFISYLQQGAELWQRYGILSALHYLFEANTIQPQGVWQALAAHKDGDRHIMDLRHVMDILAEYGLSMGEYELLAWFKQNIEQAPGSDWAKQHPLPTESGVQLMTIHKSKGLEFPIVYVMGMASASNKSGKGETYGLYLYNVEQDKVEQDNTEQPSSIATTGNKNSITLRRFSPMQGTATNKTHYIDLETDENFDERLRLGYVAFTRASEQLYIVLSDPHNTADMDLKPVFHWFETPKQKPVTYQLPDRLKQQIGYLPAVNIIDCFNSHFEQAAKSSSVSSSTSVDSESGKSISQPIEYDDFATVMKTNYFKGWAKTSFTALARQLDESAQALAVADERIDDAVALGMVAVDSRNGLNSINPTDINVSHEGSELQLKAKDDIRFSFVKGANAGTFLHEIYEKIEFTNKAQWPQVIDKAIRSYQLPAVYASREQQLRVLNEKDSSKLNNNNLAPNSNKSDDKPEFEIDDSEHKALVNWIDEVLHTPLLASNQPLIAIEPHQRVAELGFNMGLSEQFKVLQINQLFEQYVPDKDKHINLLAQSHDYLYRYLRGEIDLVYQYDNKFHVVDYKSNYLGNSLSDYSQAALKKAMSKAGYWLQAAIYQVALHRFLSMRIADYEGNEDKYLAPVEYVFLRGVHMAEAEQAEADDNTDNDFESERYGLVTWDIPIEFVKALDSLFGKPS